MGNVVTLSGHKKPLCPDTSAPDQIVLKLQPDGTYAADLSGIYATYPPLAIEHLADLISQLAQSIYT